MFKVKSLDSIGDQINSFDKYGVFQKSASVGLKNCLFLPYFTLTICLEKKNIWFQSFDLRGHHNNQHENLNKAIWFRIITRTFLYNKEKA